MLRLLGHRFTHLTAIIAAATTMVFGALSASAASAAEPWWQITSGSAPATIVPGQAKEEVQQVTVSGTEGRFMLMEKKSFKYVLFPWDATHEEVQAGLEKIYGNGNVEVTGGPGDEKGTKPYVVTFVGELEDQFTELIDGEYSRFYLKGGEKKATVTQVSEGRSDGKVIFTVANMGNAEASGATAPVTVADALPANLKAVGILGLAGTHNTGTAHPLSCTLATLSCTYSGTLPPYEQMEVTVDVNASGASNTGEANEVSVSGGNAKPDTFSRPVQVGETPVRFGVEDFQIAAEGEGGMPETQAGAHPFQLTTNFMLNQNYDLETPPAMPKDVRFNLPAGLLGNAAATAQCTEAQFEIINGTNKCPDDTAVGVAAVKIKVYPYGLATLIEPVFNLKPRPGEPARFGFIASVVPVFIDTSVRSGGDYGVSVDIKNISQQATLLGSRVTLWGVPDAAAHDNARGWSCISGKTSGCVPLNEQAPTAMLTLPASCTGSLQAGGEVDSWQRRGGFESFSPTVAMLSQGGCERLLFNPSLAISAGTQQADSPAALTAAIAVPQQLLLGANGLAEPDVKSTTVTLPAGLQVNPAAAGGLSACSESDIGYTGKDRETGGLLFAEESEAEKAGETSEKYSCPEAAKLGKVTITTPLLGEALTGWVYQSAQEANPFGSLLGLYVIAEAPKAGVRVRLAGKVEANPATGQLTATFPNTPQLPFEEFQMKFFGGNKAPLATTGCGTYTTETSIEPWSGTPAVHPFSQFGITTGPEGSAAWCQHGQPFAPGFLAGTTTNAAGSFSPFTLTLTRQDGEQAFSALSTALPKGVAGEISKVTPCGEPQAAAGQCTAASQIGHVTVQAGVGNEPVTLPEAGKPQDPVYLTGPYGGAPFGLSIVVPAEAGPFNLGTVVVRAAIHVDPHTAQASVTSAPMPTMLRGIPLDVKRIDVVIDRPQFMFNPTSCEPTAVTGTIASAQGASASVSSRFQAANCASLAFKPSFSAATKAHYSRHNGESLRVAIASGPGQANISSVHVDIPKQLPAQLPTLNHACGEAQFAANPAGCSAGSRVGMATAYTPVLPVPLTGPAIFVSHGGAAFPDLDLVLQGDGVTLILTGKTFISKSAVTSSTYGSVPDVPVSRFELVLPQGPNSALSAHGDLCARPLVMPTTITGQNGAVVKQSTRIAVSGCKPGLHVLRSKVNGSKAAIVVSVPSAGSLVASGKGISRAAAVLRRAGAARLVVKLSARERSLLARHRGRRARVHVHLLFTPSNGNGKPVSGRVTLLMR